MPLRKTSSPKAYALGLNDNLRCKRVTVDDCISCSGKRPAYQIFDDEKKVGRYASTANQAWTNAYLKLSEAS
jgi:hypothetical protein